MLAELMTSSEPDTPAQAIAEALAQINALAGYSGRHALVSGMSDCIKSRMTFSPDHPPLLDLRRLAQVCLKHEGLGYAELTSPLRKSFDPADHAVQHALSIIEQHWPPARRQPIGRDRLLEVNRTLDGLVEKLANVVRRELREEVRRWRVDYPPILGVRWRVAEDRLIVPWTEIPVGHDETRMRHGVLQEIADVYDEIPSGRLVVLGKIGSGKTTLMNFLALAILGEEATRDPAAGVPVIFNLASWNPGKAGIFKWMATVINRDHPGISIEDAGRLLAGNRILPMLDGLDEYKHAARRAVALDALSAVDIPLVVACRIDEYGETLGHSRPLRRAWAIQLEPLTLHDLNEFLPAKAHSQEGPQLWHQVLDRMSKEEPDTEILRKVLDSPLMVSLAHVMYGSLAAHKNPLELVQISWQSSRELERHLYAGFVDTLYPESRNDTPPGYDDDEMPKLFYHRDDAKRWLHFIAQQVQNGEIQWWRLGNGTPRPLRLVIFAVCAALMGAAAGLAIAGRVTLLGVRPPIGGTLAGLVLGALAGAAYGWIYEGERPIQVQLFSPAGRRNLRYELVKAPLYGITAVCAGYPLVVWGLHTYGRWGWFLFAIGGLVASIPPSLVQHWAKQPGRKPLCTEIQIASSGGVLTCLVLALIGAILDRPPGPFGIWSAAAIVYGVLLAFVYGPQAPIDANEPASPIEMVDNSRKHFRYYSIAIIVTYTASTIFVTGLSLIGIIGAVTYGSVAGLASGVVNNAWGRWAVLTRGWLRFTGDLPTDLLPFLEEAHRRHMFRQSGAVYRFSHEALERYLRELPPEAWTDTSTDAPRTSAPAQKTRRPRDRLHRVAAVHCPCGQRWPGVPAETITLFTRVFNPSAGISTLIGSRCRRPDSRYVLHRHDG
ncbi:hypothetical protein F3087_44905 [Nocardia colli]|uniref:NACHT domain-containing protein n=1 Tax=Nocardia colli TaxID=2545717 RepID=A0A5N0DKV4_9NOCA|nr:hypothetical protein [Nocardia colli]KAA8877316.1 hypothetical protein F3087_44905 [Nocardia colli]